ncbi:MAG TPA: glycerophosphodiester phosphodiesterase [Candidatus Dormibacteraeota bacterium]|nr:glycerophosphodiester phosphodiesterase [Candidatus Dormibacteraeota bacterium]
MPRSAWPFLDHPGPLAFAHRGAGGWPENTMAAFEAAVRLGYRYIETDVQVTADGVLVTFHDDRLDRLTDRSGRLAELPYAEVRRARVAGQEPIPTLEEVLGTWPELRVNVEPKHDACVEPLAEAIRRTSSLHRVCVGSFSDRRTARVRRLLGPDLCTALGPWGVAWLRAASWAPLPGRSPAACAQVPLDFRGLSLVDARFLRAAHWRGLQVHVWTVDDAAQMEALLDLGVDGVMTDRPEVLKAVLEGRGLWV